MSFLICVAFALQEGAKAVPVPYEEFVETGKVDAGAGVLAVAFS